MPLEPFFSLTPLNPYANTYDASNPNAEYANAYLTSYGGFTYYSYPYGLAAQYNNDEIIIGYDAVGLSAQSINNMTNDIYRRCTFRIHFRGTNVSTKNQYMLLLQLRGIQFANAQIFVGTDLVRKGSGVTS